MLGFKNADILLEGRILRGGELLCDNGKILAVGNDILPDGIEVIDCGGLLLSPGLIDEHTHGIVGYDFGTASEAELEKMTAAYARNGVTGVVGTVTTDTVENVNAALGRVGRVSAKETDGAALLGAHLEGIFLSHPFKGAHIEEYLKEPDFSLIEENAGSIRLLTMAPELPGADEFLAECRRRGILVNIGHTAGTVEQIGEVLEKGADGFTHTFNAMSGLHHRNPGAAAAALVLGGFCELVADNIHVHPVMQRLLWKMAGPERTVLITDSMEACGMPEGVYCIGGQETTVKNGRVTLSNGTIAGSVLTLNKGVKNFAENNGLSLEEALPLASRNPARRLRLAGKGVIAPGMDADLALFDPEMNAKLTVVGGRVVFDGR